MNIDLSGIAANIRSQRRRNRLTLDALAKKTGVTKGFISQIENMRALPSLSFIYRAAETFGIEPSLILTRTSENKPYLLTQNGKGEAVEREYPESGFVYRALANRKIGKMMEPFILDLPPHSTRKNVTTSGEEFLFVIKGKIDFILGRDKLGMGTGDSLYFDGTIPHHPENNSSQKSVAIVVYALK